MKIGITGGIGSGKSTVTDHLTDKGYEVIDCDKLARQVVEKGSDTLKKLAVALGEEILAGDGSLDREATAKIVFADEEKRETLNAITHGAIYDIINRKIEETPDNVHFIDAPLLFESGLNKEMDAVWVVTCRDDVRKERIALRDNMDEEMIQARIDSQMDDREKTALADEVLDNSGTKEELYARVEELLEKYVG